MANYALSVVAAIGCVVYGFWDERYFFGIGFLLAALMYWESIRWVDRNGSWGDDEPNATADISW
ncbi:MAG: hypothetical protein K8U57_34395 [Planctomycetes bacterium]|nr:hypothetical protein [Planctomycetota bacterium]